MLLVHGLSRDICREVIYRRVVARWVVSSIGGW